MIAHCPSVSEREPQGWIINWMTDRLAAYQFRELESTERFGERILWTNHFTERILEIQFSKKKLPFPSLLMRQCRFMNYGSPWGAISTPLTMRSFPPLGRTLSGLSVLSGNSLKQGENSKLCCFSATCAFCVHLWSVAEWTTDIILKTGFEFCVLCKC